MKVQIKTSKHCLISPPHYTQDNTFLVYPGSSCRDDGFTCDDGQCVHISKYCDFVQDCDDGTDEQECGKQFSFLSSKFSLPILYKAIVILFVIYM